MLLPGRVADDDRKTIMEVRSTLNLDTERWIRNAGMHDCSQPTDQPTKELTKDKFLGI
jgi:hypothetical protein